MRKLLLLLASVALCSTLFAQQSLNNESIIKLVKAGLSDDLIVTTINASPGIYDTSADGLIALKTAGASEKVVSAIVIKASAPAATAPIPPPPPVAEPAAPGQVTPPPGAPGPLANKPRVFLQSVSHGNQRNAARDQSMEMSKDFEKDCPEVRITINQQMAEYTVALNHIEVGFSRDNQFQIANKDGDLISKTKEGGSIDGGVKKACRLILGDWAKQSVHP
jgi:hypothetical protein